MRSPPTACRYWLPAASCPKHVHCNQARWWKAFYFILPHPTPIVLHLPNDAWTHPREKKRSLNDWIIELLLYPNKIKLNWFPLLPKLTTGALVTPNRHQIGNLTDCCLPSGDCHYSHVSLFVENTHFHSARMVVICFHMFYGTVGDRLLDRLLYWLMAVSTQPHVFDSCATPLLPDVELHERSCVWGVGDLGWSWW